MSDAPQGRGVPMWVFVTTFLVVAVVAALVGWFIGNPRPATVVVIPPRTTTSTVQTTVTVPATITVEPTATVPPVTTKEWAFLTGGSVSGGKLSIKADYIYFYPAGASANAAKAKYGGALRFDGSYVRNTSSVIKTLTLKPTANIQLIEWIETGTMGSSWKYGKADPNAFVAVLAGSANSPSGVWTPVDHVLRLTVTGDTVSAITQYQPPQ